MDHSLTQFDPVLTLMNCAASSLIVWLVGILAARLHGRTSLGLRHNVLLVVCLISLFLPVMQYGLRGHEIGMMKLGRFEFRLVHQAIGAVWLFGTALLLARLALGFIVLMRIRGTLVESTDVHVRKIMNLATSHVGLDSSIPVSVYEDRNRGYSWSGPLIVLTNSLSASEIVAGAIQNYGRGIVVGDKRTHGKGTVQSPVNVAERLFGPVTNLPNCGALKITMQTLHCRRRGRMHRFAKRS